MLARFEPEPHMATRLHVIFFVLGPLRHTMLEFLRCNPVLITSNSTTEANSLAVSSCTYYSSGDSYGAERIPAGCEGAYRPRSVSV